MKMLLGGLAAAGLIVAVQAAVIELKNREERGLRETIAGHDACAAAFGGADLVVSAERCAGPLAAAHRGAVLAARCDAALKAGDAYGTAAACSAEVKHVVAEADARTRERDRLQTQLTDTRARQAAAIAAAEARGRAQTQRTESAEADLAAAPRTDGGLGRCDADCLRNLGR